MDTTYTQLSVPGLDCPGCIRHIKDLVQHLQPRPHSVTSSFENKTVAVSHDADLDSSIILDALVRAGYKEAVLAQPKSPSSSLHDVRLSRLLKRLLKPNRSSEIQRGKARLANCDRCPKGRHDDISAVPEDVKIGDRFNEKADLAPLESVQVTSPSGERFRALLSITGMTCSACVRAITEALECKPYVLVANVVLLANSAIVEFEGQDHSGEITETIEDLGYGVAVGEIKSISQQQLAGKARYEAQYWRASFVIEGMISNSDALAIADRLGLESWIQKTTVEIEDESLTVEFESKKHIPEIPVIIASVGDQYQATLLDLVKIGSSEDELATRTVSIEIRGCSSEESLSEILAALNALGHPVVVDKPPTLAEPIVTITYTPEAPRFTIRQILTAMESAEGSLKASVYHPPTLEERARVMHARERRNVIFRVLLSLMAAIPSFIIGIVLMSLVSSSNSARVYLSEPWANVSRSQWALLIISTPVYFFAADLFHRRAAKELYALWRPGSSTPVFRRLYRFGSMNLLMSLGTSIAYFASIVELIMTSRQHLGHMSGHESFYFDSVVFLTLFLLCGRLIEAYSRAKTADAVTSLGQLRPTEAVICDAARVEKSNSALIRKTPVDTVEVGDIILIAHGASPPCDGILLDGQASFDESSLTGESRPVVKKIGDDVLSGTINQGVPIFVRVTEIVGSSMLDQIIQAVRDGQARRAPVERLGDTITSYFVPVITIISITTWIIWLVLGETGCLPQDWLDVESGGWPYWSLQFSIAVFIIACPCGFGLAAPTAMFVGGGLAAKNGILAKGGGEAFQEASTLDLVVFDKTGTLTEGGKPSVTEWRDLQTSTETRVDSRLVQSLVRAVEEKSTHPIASALVGYLEKKDRITVNSAFAEELPGRGMKGQYGSDQYPDKSFMVLVGNERLMSENEVNVDASAMQSLQSWKVQGKSVVLAATKMSDPDAGIDGTWELRVIAAVSDPIRPESAMVIQALRKQGIDVWMISGDNETTACAVGRMVGIAQENIIAGVLPEQKAEKIQYLQRSQSKPRKTWLLGTQKSPTTQVRATVAMVGDGVNDSPALTVADVGIAIGSGSDVAISSADFVLLSSDLSAVLVLIQLSRVVFRRIKFNFGWALVYNLIALPIAAGVLYPVRSRGSHVRLDPVWASLAMALSSISVVSSSLALKTELPYLGFRKAVIDTERTTEPGVEN
jgi:Cu+-exporting ATPase